MSISIITFAQLGDRRNLKTAAIEPVVRKFAEENELEQVFCHSAKNYFFRNTISCLPKGVLWTLKGIKKYIYPSLNVRDWQEYIFDLVASLRLKKADVVLFHPARFDRTMNKAKKKGSVIVGIATVPHPQASHSLLKDEPNYFGLPSSEETPEKGSQIAELFDYIIALSDFVKETYIKAGYPTEKIFVANLDIDTEKFAPQEKQDSTFRVVMVAEIGLRKGLHYLLEAWQKSNLKKAELIIVGRFGVPQKIKEEYKRIINNGPTIRWVGHSDEPERYYKDASVFVLPSLSEGFPKVVLEAMASGLPVITTENAKGLVEDGETGYVVPIRDSEFIKEKLEFLYNNENIRREMSEKAREVAVSKKPFGESVFEIYEKIKRNSK